MRASELAIVEKKRRKRKTRWAAYGPGPYGGYGFDAGYSGDAGIGEFAVPGDDGDDPFDNYPCYDCGSTIFLHHTELCELAEPNAIRDLPSKPGSQHWTGEIPKGLHPIPGLEKEVEEASYDGNVGMMEVAKFFQVATEAQKKLFKELLEKGKRGLAWKLIQDVTDTKLQGKEFEVNEGFQQRTIDKLSGLGLQGPYQKKELVAMNSAWRKILSDVSSSAQVMVQDSNNPRHSAWISPEGSGRWMVGAEDGYAIKSGPSALQQLQFFLRTDEGWRDTLAGLALGGAVAMGGAQAKGVDSGEKYHGYSEPIQLIQKVEKGDTVYSLAREFGVTPRDIQRVNKLDKNFTIKPGQELAIPKQSKPAEIEYKKSDKPASTKGKLLYNNADEQRLLLALISNGFRGAELAAFMAQAAHETRNFESMVEEGSPRYFMRYDPSSKNPKHRESASNLGNTKKGDGARFKGRGHLQITGRWNYGAVGRLIGVDLIKNPELLENPDIGIKASIAFWKMRVQPNVTDYNNVRQVTRPINKGLDKLAQRKEKFKNYKILLAKR